MDKECVNLNLKTTQINSSTTHADYYNKTVTTNAGQVSNNRQSYTWNNVNMRCILGDMYDKYDRFNICLNNVSMSPPFPLVAGISSSVVQTISGQFFCLDSSGFPLLQPYVQLANALAISLPNGTVLTSLTQGVIGYTTLQSTTDSTIYNMSSSLSVNSISGTVFYTYPNQSNAQNFRGVYAYASPTGILTVDSALYPSTQLYVGQKVYYYNGIIGTVNDQTGAYTYSFTNPTLITAIASNTPMSATNTIPNININSARNLQIKLTGLPFNTSYSQGNISTTNQALLNTVNIPTNVSIPFYYAFSEKTYYTFIKNNSSTCNITIDLHNVETDTYSTITSLNQILGHFIFSFGIYGVEDYRIDNNKHTLFNHN